MPPNKSKKKKLIPEEIKNKQSREKDEIKSDDEKSSENESDVTEKESDDNTEPEEKSDEKYDEVEDEDDAFGDDANEVEDEDEKDNKSEQQESESESEEEVKEKEEEKEEEVKDEGSDECMYRFSKKPELVDDEDVDGEYFFDEEKEDNSNDIFVPNNERITKPVLTKFERVRLLGERAKQLSLGAKPMIKNLTNMDPKIVAKLELQMKVIPIIVIRTLPTGRKERWKINELAIVN